MDYGIRDCFGIPGDYVLAFYSELERSPINVIGCTREDCAGFAADGYARLTGMGAVCITYCVGGLSVCNSIARRVRRKVTCRRDLWRTWHQRTQQRDAATSSSARLSHAAQCVRELYDRGY